MCLLKTAMPIHKAIVEDLFVWKNMTVQEALNKGFDVGYDFSYMNSCTIWESSAGIFGSDSNTPQFRCLCCDQPSFWHVKSLVCYCFKLTNISCSLRNFTQTNPVDS